MGWLSAGSGTLIVAYLIYAVVVGLASRQRAAKHPEATVTVDGDVVKDSASNSERIPPVSFEERSVPSSPSSQPPEAVVTSPAAENASVPVLMAPPPPPPPPQPRPSSQSQPPTVRSSSPPRLKPPAMSAPPRPGNGLMRPPPPSAAASLRVPQTKTLSNTHMQPASSTLGVPKKRSKQVTLGPGYSPLDWAALTANPNSGLRGKDAPDHLMRVTPSRLKKQTGRKGKDAWTVYQGRVYNITPYLPFHPGGVAELMKGAGRDGGRLFMEVHPWVNWDGMLGECLVGILVAEDDADASSHTNKLDEMD